MLRGTYIELQFSRRSILDLVRTSLVLNYPPFNPILPPSGRQLPVAADGSTYVVSQTAFLTEPGATSLRRGDAFTWSFEWEDLSTHFEDVPAHRCQVTQRLRLVVARRTFPDKSPPLDVDIGTIDGTLVATLGAVAVENVPTFLIGVNRFTVDTDGVDPALVQALQSGIPSSFNALAMPLPLRQLLGQPTPGGPAGYDPNASAPHVQNCAVAYASDLSTFALRIQLGGAPASVLVTEWTPFHAGAFPNRLHVPNGLDRQWGVLLSPSLIEALTVQQTEDQLADHADDFRLRSGVGAQWAPQGSEPHVEGQFDGTVLVPCRPDYHVSFDARVEITAPNQLVSTTSISRHGSFWDLLACEGLAALGGGVSGAIAGAGIGGPLGAGIGLAIGVGVGFFGAMVVATVYSPDMGTDSCSQDGDVVTCTRAMNPALQFAGASLDIQLVDAAATDDGLMLGGTYALPLIPALHHTIVELDVRPFDYAELPVNCANLGFALLLATSDAESASFATPEATITVRAVDDDGRSQRLAWLTVTRTSPDPEGVFPASAFQIVPYSDRTVIFVHPRVSETLNAGYWENAYGVSLAIGTPGTTRTVTLGPVARLTPKRLRELRDAAFRKLNDCLAKQAPFDTAKKRLEWLIDPSDDRAVRSWQVAVLNLAPNEAVRLEDGQGRALATSRADGRGVARLAVRTPDGAANRELVVHRAGAGARAARQLDIRLKQIELLPQGMLAPGGVLRNVVAREVRGRQLVALHTTDVVALYDLTFPGTPRAVLRGDAGAIDGIALLDTALVGWGRQGLAAWSFGGQSPRRLIDVPVLGARRDRGRLLVTTAAGELRVDGDGAVPIAAPRPTAAGCDDAVGRLVREAVGATADALDALLGPTASSGAAAPGPASYTVGTTLLVASDDGRALHHYVAGRWVDR